MYPSTNFMSIWKKTDYGTKFAQKHEWQKFWKNKHHNRNKHIECTPAPNFSWFRELQILGPNLPKKMWMTKFWRNKHSIRNEDIAMYPCTKF